MKSTKKSSEDIISNEELLEIELDTEKFITALLSKGLKEGSTSMEIESSELSKLPPAVIDMLINQLSHRNQQLLSECENLFGLKSIVEPIITEIEAEQYVHNRNPYIREKIAEQGYFPDILKHDPVPMVRLAVLRKTGKYSQYFRTKERDTSVIREMILLGIEHYFFKQSPDPLIQKIVKEVEIYKEILIKIDKFDFNITRDIISHLENQKCTSSADNLQIEQSISYLKIKHQNNEKRFDIETSSDVILEEETRQLIDNLLPILQENPYTPLGLVINISEDSKTIFIKTEKTISLKSALLSWQTYCYNTSIISLKCKDGACK